MRPIQLDLQHARPLEQGQPRKAKRLRPGQIPCPACGNGMKDPTRTHRDRDGIRCPGSLRPVHLDEIPPVHMPASKLFGSDTAARAPEKRDRPPAMTPDERRHGTGKSGWCMTTVRPGEKDCDHCQFAACTHDCHRRGA